ncbi:MAG: TonB-dependent receptor, partial [Pseudomonadota bacterium]
MTSVRRALFGGAALSALCGLTGAPQMAAAQESGLEEASTRLDMITVTARRREENLQDIPLSVSAFTADAIATLQADDLSGLQYAVPNFYFDEGDASNAVVYLRGVGQNDSLAFADSGVGVYVDDVFIARSQAAFLELFDVEAVEVLRGPQGTLYGRNTIGGAVKFISKKPTDEFEARLEAGVGNFDFATVKGRVSGPIAEGVLRGKVAFAYSRRDGYNTNLFTGEDDGDQNSFSGRAGLYYEPTDTFQVDLTIDGRIERPDTARNPTLATGGVGIPDPVNDPFTLQAFGVPDDPFIVNVNAGGLSDTEAYGVTLKATWNATDAITLESITSYRSFDFDLNLDTDGTPLPLLDVLVIQDQSQVTQELRATYDNDGRFVFTGGLFYFHDDDLTFSGVDNGSASLFGFPVTAFGLATSSLADTDQITDSYAIFGDATYDITDKLSFSAGLRYTYEEKESARRFENFFDPTFSVIQERPEFLSGVGVPGVTIEGETDFDAFTPKFSLSYQATDDILLYASASRGFKSGGFSGRANSEFGFEPFEPEFVWSYEGGVKSSWADGRLIANLAYFYNDYTDIQVTAFGADPVTGVFVDLFTNAAAATIQGVEVELFANPTQALSLTGSVGFLDAEYDEFEALVNGVPTDVSDRPLVNAPEWSASMGATYTAPMNNILTGVVHADLAYRSEFANEVTGSPALTQESYWLANAFVAVKTDDGRWEARAGVRNIGDEEIIVQGFNLLAFPGLETAF